jgi:hypothetical protein
MVAEPVRKMVADYRSPTLYSSDTSENLAKILWDRAPRKSDI